MFRWTLAFQIAILTFAATSHAQTGLRFDAKKGVIGKTADKRQWLDNVLTQTVKDPKAQREAKLRLQQLAPPQIDALANQVLAQHLHRLQQAQFELAQAQGVRQQLQWQRAMGRRAVGFAPVITHLPEGINLGAMAVVSPDRRHVRMSLSPMFSSIPYWDTFNFHTGQTRRYYSRAPQHPYSPYYQQQLPPRPSAYAKTWHDGLRTRVGPRPGHSR